LRIENEFLVNRQSAIGNRQSAIGTFILQNINASAPALPQDVRIARLRIVQVVPKSTPCANNPTVGVPNVKAADLAQPIPAGPAYQAVADKAREHHMYVVGCFPEREGKLVYNTAFLVDREGKLVGKYRKVHLPEEEVDGGYTPGDDFPVFATDFGPVGMMICWDVSFPEVARILTLKGARIILMPIWDGLEPLTQARAVENGCFVIQSSYGSPTCIIDPRGKVLATTGPDKEVAQKGVLVTTKVDLADQYRLEGLGYWWMMSRRERRTDVFPELLLPGVPILPARGR
jgi:predicted amidohydrolase